MRSHRREAITFYLTISPWLIGFLVFILAPMAIALYLSFTRWDLFGAPQWIGLENYARMARDPLFAQALKVTTIYTLVYVPMEMIGGMSLALLVNQKVRGVGVFRTIFYLPSVLAGVAYVVVVHKQQRAASFRCSKDTGSPDSWPPATRLGWRNLYQPPG